MLCFDLANFGILMVLVTSEVEPKETIKPVNLDDSQPKTRVEGPRFKIANGDYNATSNELMKPTNEPDDVDSFSLGTVNREIIINEGITITMQCSASIDRFPDDIKWYNTSNLLATDGRVVIKETKETPLHSSHLTIGDIQKWDKGDYTCERTTKNVCLSELTITPIGQIVINEGDLLAITCTASEDVDFFYPQFISFLVDTSPSLITNEPANGGSKFIFKRPKAVYGDTGYYGCVEASKNKRKLNLRNIYVTPETYDEIDIKWTYVYVKCN
ncbi:Protein of unknown function [Cotesia congregata]|uniref:Ig-like domain-containing protein n=1 Tax=Cotesia congregata TaxID=51543 RepID=A0A8J2H6N4_COTCN|nr:Protein of unknown function [Cotesia congregata]